MRKRLLTATLDCLAQDGYAGTSVSSIVKRAGVSRGAQVHHYPSKNALILDAAAYLMRRAYRILGEVLLGIANEEDRLQALMEATWKEIFDTRMFSAYFELVIASQRDAELAAALRGLSGNAQQTLQTPVTHYFEPLAPHSENPRQMFIATALMFGAMTATSHLAANPAEVRRYLELWSRLMAGQMRARKGVVTPPPRPQEWDLLKR
ncbi:MAG: TetR/AcrR family transcriptional regulator [Nevskiales bacterium]